MAKENCGKAQSAVREFLEKTRRSKKCEPGEVGNAKEEDIGNSLLLYD